MALSYSPIRIADSPIFSNYIGFVKIRCQQEPIAVVPLPHHTPSDRVKPLNPYLSQAASLSPPRWHNARGARHIRRWTPPRSRRAAEDIARGASPLLPQYSVSRIRFFISPSVWWIVWPRISKTSPNNRNAPVSRQHLVAPPVPQPPTPC